MKSISHVPLKGHPVSHYVSFVKCSDFHYRTTESVRLRDNAVKKSLDVQRQRNDETLKARKAQKQRAKQLRSQVCVKAMANDHSWKLKKSNEQKLKTFRYNINLGIRY